MKEISLRRGDCSPDLLLSFLLLGLSFFMRDSLLFYFSLGKRDIFFCTKDHLLTLAYSPLNG